MGPFLHLYGTVPSRVSSRLEIKNTFISFLPSKVEFLEVGRQIRNPLRSEGFQSTEDTFSVANAFR